MWYRAGLIALQDVVGEASQSGEDARIFPDSRCVLAEADIARVVGCVLDAPVLADGGGGGFGFDGATGQIERGFGTGFPTSCSGLEVEDRAVHPDDGGPMGLPFRLRDGRLGREDSDGAGFVAIASVFVDASFARQRLGQRADRLDVPIEVRLIVLDLNDQMRGRGCGGFKRFF